MLSLLATIALLGYFTLLLRVNQGMAAHLLLEGLSLTELLTMRVVPALMFAIPVAIWARSLFSVRLRSVLAPVEVGVALAGIIWALRGAIMITRFPTQGDTRYTVPWALGLDSFLQAALVCGSAVAMARAATRDHRRHRLMVSVTSVVVVTGVTIWMTLPYQMEPAPPAMLMLPTSPHVQGAPLGMAAFGTANCDEGIAFSSHGAACGVHTSTHAGDWVAAYLEADDAGKMQLLLRGGDDSLLAQRQLIARLEGAPCQAGATILPIAARDAFAQQLAIRARRIDGVLQQRLALDLDANDLTPASHLRLILTMANASPVCGEMLEPALVAPWQAGSARLERDCVAPLSPTREERIALTPDSFQSKACRTLASKVLDSTHLVLAGGPGARRLIERYRDCMKEHRPRPIQHAGDIAWYPIGEMLARSGFSALDVCQGKLMSTPTDAWVHTPSGGSAPEDVSGSLPVTASLAPTSIEVLPQQ